MPKKVKKDLTYEERYRGYTDLVIGMWKDAMRERINETKKLVSFQCHRGDCHAHSTYSDGVGTVADCKTWVDKAGLDFFFLTDHDTVRQKVECKRYENFWWGQEPGTQYHHLLILDIDRRYQVKRDLVYDYNRVRELGGLPIIPHPTGWFPVTRYNEEQMKALELLGDHFAIEIINGANNLFDCFDITDALSIELWDKLLCQGRRVVAFGNTDAHLPQAIGDVWNGVLGVKLAKAEVRAALEAGHHFVSDAPLMQWKSGNALMGDVIQAKPKSEVSFQYECADSLGLRQVRIFRNGKAWKTIEAKGQAVVKGSVSDRFPGGKSYYRLEAFAMDQRRAYSNPIYVRETM